MGSWRKGGPVDQASEGRGMLRMGASSVKLNSGRQIDMGKGQSLPHASCAAC